MPPTPFPTKPSDVVALTVLEFTCDLDLNGSTTVESACQRFLHDANRALVWLIRFHALTAWCERTDVAPLACAARLRAGGELRIE